MGESEGRRQGGATRYMSMRELKGQESRENGLRESGG